MATASGLSDYAAAQLLNYLLRGTAPTGNPSLGGNWSLALYTAAPTSAGGGTECSYSGYARVNAVCGTTDFSTPSGSGTVSVQQATLKNFGANGSGSTVTVVGWGIFGTGGNLWAFGQFSPTVAVLANEVPQLAANSLTIELVSGSSTSGFTDYASDQILGYLFNGASLGAPSTWYTGLCTTASSPSSIGTETTYLNYLRQGITVGTGAASLASGASPVAVTITPVLTFPPNGSGSTVTMLGYGLWDLIAAGHEWIFGPLSSTPIAANVEPQFAASSISITLTSQT